MPGDGSVLQLGFRSADYRVVVEDGSTAIYTHDLDGRITYANAAFERLVGRSQNVLVGRPLVHLVPEAGRAVIEALIERTGSGGGSAEFEIERPDGNNIPVEANCILIRDRLGDPAVLAVVRDVTARRAQTEALRHRALHDPLTGLHNRVAFDDRLRQAAMWSERSGEGFAVLLIDLDGFKDVNDLHGHQEGDLVLRDVAYRLASVLRASDTIARLGGDEFAAILPHTDALGAEVVARKLRGAVARSARARGVAVGASIGISLCPQHLTRGESPEELLRIADAAMYVAKGKRTGVFLYPSAGNGVRELLRRTAFRQRRSGRVAGDGRFRAFIAGVAAAMLIVAGIESIPDGFRADDDRTAGVEEDSRSAGAGPDGWASAGADDFIRTAGLLRMSIYGRPAADADGRGWGFGSQRPWGRSADSDEPAEVAPGAEAAPPAAPASAPAQPAPQPAPETVQPSGDKKVAGKSHDGGGSKKPKAVKKSGGGSSSGEPKSPAKPARPRHSGPAKAANAPNSGGFSKGASQPGGAGNGGASSRKGKSGGGSSNSIGGGSSKSGGEGSSKSGGSSKPGGSSKSAGKSGPSKRSS